jgi:hypothetical protein
MGALHQDNRFERAGKVRIGHESGIFLTIPTIGTDSYPYPAVGIPLAKPGTTRLAERDTGHE